MVIMRRAYANMWTLIAAPTIWAMHFLFVYVVAAVYCAKAEGIFVNIASVQVIVAAATAICLFLVLLSARQAYRHWGFGDSDPPHDKDTEEDRQRFLGFTTLLLSGLSTVGILFDAMPALFIGDCR